MSAAPHARRLWVNSCIAFHAAPPPCPPTQVLREQIIKLPPRHDTQQAIDAVNQDIASIQAATRQQEVLHEVVSKKAAAVFYHLDDLLSSFPTAESLARDAAGGGGGDAAQAMQVDG